MREDLTRLPGALAMLVSLAAATAPAQEGGRRQQPFTPQNSVWSTLSIPELRRDPEDPAVLEFLSLAMRWPLVAHARAWAELVVRTRRSHEELCDRLSLDPAGMDEGGIPLYRHRATGMLFVFVPGGTFWMGSDHSEIYDCPAVLRSARVAKESERYFTMEQPKHEVYVSPFFIGVYEVTVAEYRRFLEAWERGDVAPFELPLRFVQEHRPHLFDQPVPFWDDRQPVAGIHWLSAVAFSRWMGGRLPTEAEWEKAARGTDGRRFPWGDTFDPLRANTREALNCRTVPVGTYRGGRSPYGCLDMAGNVSEYTLDALEITTYLVAPRTDPCLVDRFPRTRLRVVRGGSWNDHSGGLHRARTTSRDSLGMTIRFSEAFEQEQYLHFGFRVVLSPREEPFPESWLQALEEDVEDYEEETEEGK